jgi:hypothetical protein
VKGEAQEMWSTYLLMTCITGSTILLWSHGRTPVLVRRDPMRFRGIASIKLGASPVPPGPFPVHVQLRAPPESKAPVDQAGIGGGWCLRRWADDGGRWKEERRRRRSEDWNGGGGSGRGKTKSCGERNIGWSEDPANKTLKQISAVWTLGDTPPHPPSTLSMESAGDTCTHLGSYEGDMVVNVFFCISYDHGEWLKRYAFINFIF